MEGGKIRVGKGEGVGKGKGKEKQEQAAFLPPVLERTASGENQNTPSHSPASRHSCAASHAARRHGDTT